MILPYKNVIDQETSIKREGITARFFCGMALWTMRVSSPDSFLRTECEPTIKNHLTRISADN